MNIPKSTRKKIGWLVALGAVAAMVLGNLTAGSPLASVLGDLGALAALALGMVLIVA